MENTLFDDTLLVTTRGPMETLENRCLADSLLIVSVQSTVPECVSPVRGEQGYVGRFARRVGRFAPISY